MRTRIACGAALGLISTVVFVSLPFRVELLAQQDPSDLRPSDPSESSGSTEALLSDESEAFQERFDPFGSETTPSKVPKPIADESESALPRPGSSSRRSTLRRDSASEGPELDSDSESEVVEVGSIAAPTLPHQLRIIRLRNLRAVEVYRTINNLFDPNAADSNCFLGAEEQSNSLIFKGPADKFEQIKRLADELDRLSTVRPTQTRKVYSYPIPHVVIESEDDGIQPNSEEWSIRVIQLRNVKANEFYSIAYELVRSQNKKTQLMIECEESTNCVILRGTAAELEQVQELAEQLDAVAGLEGSALSNGEPIELPHSVDDPLYSNTDGNSDLSTLRISVKDIEAQSQQIRQQIVQADKESVVLAGELRNMQQRYGKQHPKFTETRAKLEVLVDESFGLRLQLQGNEVAVIKHKLHQIESRFQQRAQLRQQIIDRRLRELLGQKDDLDWEATQPTRLPQSVGTPPGIVLGDVPVAGLNIGLPPAVSGSKTLPSPSKPVEVPANAPKAVPVPGDGLSDTVEPWSPRTASRNVNSLRELVQAELAIKAAVLNVQKLESRLAQMKDSADRKDAEYDLQLARLELKHSELMLQQKRSLIEATRESLLLQIRYFEKEVESVTADYMAVTEVSKTAPSSVSAAEIRKYKLAVEKAELRLEQAKSDLQIFGIQNPESNVVLTPDEALNGTTLDSNQLPPPASKVRPVPEGNTTDSSFDESTPGSDNFSLPKGGDS